MAYLVVLTLLQYKKAGDGSAISRNKEYVFCKERRKIMAITVEINGDPGSFNLKSSWSVSSSSQGAVYT